MVPIFLTILRDLNIAFRNVVRHRRRAAFALLIISGGVISFDLASVATWPTTSPLTAHSSPTRLAAHAID